MHPTLRALAVLGATFSATACATIMHGSNQKIQFNSTPSQAQVMIDGNNVGVTPMVTTLKRGDSHTVRITAPGFQPYEMKLEKKVSGWIAGNLVFGGIPGVIVDAVTGSMYKLSPSEVNATLGAGSSAARNGDQIFVAVVLQADPSWEKIGQMVRE